MNRNEMDTLLKKVLEEKQIKSYFDKFSDEWNPGNTDVTPATDSKELASMIDHTYLKPDATLANITKLCNEAREYSFISVCVNPGYVAKCVELLKGSNVKVCTVIGFPLGQNTTATKAAETGLMLELGATEVDMVINVGKLKDAEYEYIYNDIKAVASAAKSKNALSKVIIETCLLTDEEKVKACILAKAAGADFVKTSTGFSTGGATKEDIALMRYVVGDNTGVKASGGVRSREDALNMITNGATRIGASAGIKIVSGEGTSDGY